MTALTHLECSSCGTKLDATKVHGLCACGGPLLARYDSQAVRQSWSREWLPHGTSNLWRYAPMLPVGKPGAMISLGEAMTPLFHLRRLGQSLGANNIWLKDESLNPTGSCKARGLACAISRVVELGIQKVAIASAGNAAGATAAYAAVAGVEAHVFMPKDVPQSNYLECKAYGAFVTLVDGLISDCAAVLAAGAEREGWFDLSTLKEPYRLEGNKTLGYELAEQSRWELPDAILYPTGGGLGLIGMWKAFQEMEELGWISEKRPKMVAVQAAGCAPIVKALEDNALRCDYWADAVTLASGLRVPKPSGDFLILEGIRASGGTAVAVSDAELMAAGLRLATEEGIFAAPEGAACVAALQRLLAEGSLRSEERVVIFNTASGLKYTEAYSTRFPRLPDSEYDKLGGLITPR